MEIECSNLCLPLVNQLGIHYYNINILFSYNYNVCGDRMF
nr:MAG TPA: hypothetical protein [Caudoviricetes sp.]